MLVFSTVLNINPSMTKKDFAETVIRWVKTNPRPVNVISGIEWNGSYNIRYGSERLWLEFMDYDQKNILAARFEKHDDDGIVWDTDYVMNFNEMKMSIRLDRTYTDDDCSSEDDGHFATPHFISILIEKGYLRRDDILPVLRTPIMIDDTNLSLAAYAILGDTRYYLPVVYISKTFTDEYPVDINLMASKLKGAAHVLVQESDSTTQMMREASDGLNPYNGSIGVYYPDNTYDVFYYERYGVQDAVFERTIEAVLNYVNAQVPEALYTWIGVKNAIQAEQYELRNKIREEEMRRIAEERASDPSLKEAEEIIAEFDNELKDQQKLLHEQAEKIEALQYENQKLKAKVDAAHVSDKAILYTGSEKEFYEGEIQDLILTVLSDTLKNMAPDTRRAHVVGDLVAYNEFKHMTKAKADEIKRLFNNFDGMNGKLLKDLKSMGFEIEYNGKHYKLKYGGDDRYTVTVASSPSDKARSGKNDAHTIINKVF